MTLAAELRSLISLLESLEVQEDRAGEPRFQQLANQLVSKLEQRFPGGEVEVDYRFLDPETLKSSGNKYPDIANFRIYDEDGEFLSGLMVANTGETELEMVIPFDDEEPYVEYFDKDERGIDQIAHHLHKLFQQNTGIDTDTVYHE